MIINKEAINQAIADFDSIENAIEVAGVDVPYGTDTSEYGNKITEACQANYQKGYDNGTSEGESGIITIIDPAIESHGVEIPEGMDKSGYADKIDEVYQVGYDTGLVDGGIDWSQWTDWQYFSYYNNRNDLVAKLKYSDTANGTNFYSMFFQCSKLTTIPQLDTSKGTDFSNMFNGCSKLTTIPQLDTSSGTSFFRMFSQCNALTTIPQLDTSKGTNFSNMFESCSKLTTISLLNISSLYSTNWSNMFQNCTALENVTFEGTIPVRGNMSVFSSCPNLTVESLMSFINALTNMSSSSTYKITIGSTNLAKLTQEQIKIATDKRIRLQ